MELYNGDCLGVLKDIASESVDLFITDPPYKIISGGCRISAKDNECSGIFNRRKDNKRTDWVDDVRTGKMFEHNELKFIDWLPEVFRIMKNGTHIYIMTNDRNMQELLNAGTKVGFKVVNILTWIKNNVTPNKYYMKNTEFAVMFRKGKARSINDMGSKQAIEIDNIIGKKTHPTEKPTKLMEYWITNSTNEGELVVDPFMGTGASGVACINANRNFIGIELDKNYFEIAESRIKESGRQVTIKDI